MTGGASDRPFAGGFDRRSVIGGVAGASLFRAAAASRTDTPIIDTHVHIFDPRRPQGAPYRGPSSAPYYTEGAFPETYARIGRRQGVVGAIAIEVSPWLEDNLWLLDRCEAHPYMVGVVGDLRPEQEDFAEALDRFAAHPLFLGIRYGNLWNRDIAARSREASFLAGLKHLAERGLVLDTANPNVALLQAVIRISDAIPELRIVIDHLPKLDPKPGEERAYDEALRTIAARPNLFAKLSGIIHRRAGQVETTLAAYRERLDRLAATFGPTRMLFGSDWPNIEYDTPVENEFAVTRAYMAGQEAEWTGNFLWRNSWRAYRWQPRTAEQRRLLAGSSAAR